MTPEYRTAARCLYANGVLVGGSISNAARLTWIAEGQTWSSALGLSLAIAGAAATCMTRRSRGTLDALVSDIIAGAGQPGSS